jgi:hypothetical protein
MLITVLTTIWFLQHKSIDKERYMAEVQHADVCMEIDPNHTVLEMENMALLKTPIVDTADIV